MAVVVGLDVAVARGSDVVAIDDDLVARPIGRVHTGDEFRALLDDMGPRAVAIDSPPRWATPGRPRACERELTRRGISLFTTPDAAKGTASAFYAWMEVGFQMFTAADAYSPLETFPHAIAVAIHGHLPRETKRASRLAALRSVGVEVAALRNIDQIDATLCAYTAWCWTRGQSVSVGDPEEGQITLPVTVLRDRYRYRYRKPE